MKFFSNNLNLQVPPGIVYSVIIFTYLHLSLNPPRDVKKIFSAFRENLTSCSLRLLEFKSVGIFAIS